MENALKSLWNHGGSMFTTFWIVIALYALGGYLVWAFIQLDAEFSRPLSGGVIPENVTQQIAWGTRAFSVVAGSMAIYFHVKDMPSWRLLFSILTAIAALILLLHAYGISAKIMQGQFNADAGIEQVATVNTEAIAKQITDLEQERDALRADTQVTLDTYQRAIDNITSDGLDNDDQAEAYAIKQEQALQARDARLGEIRTEIAALRSEGRSVASVATQEQVSSDSFNPLFTFGARLTTWEWNPAVDPSDVHKFAWGVFFFTLFFGFGEILMMASFTGGYAALKVVSERQSKEEADSARSEAAKKGWETRKENEQAKKQITDTEYWRQRINKALNTRLPRPTATGLSETYFGGMSVHELGNYLRHFMKKGFILDPKTKELLQQEHVDFILREGRYAPPPPAVNGHDHSTEDNDDADDDATLPSAS